MDTIKSAELNAQIVTDLNLRDTKAMLNDRNCELCSESGVDVRIENKVFHDAESTCDDTNDSFSFTNNENMSCGNAGPYPGNGECMGGANTVKGGVGSPKKKHWVTCELCDSIVTSDMSLHITQEHSEVYKAHAIRIDDGKEHQWASAFGDYACDAVNYMSADNSAFHFMQNACGQFNSIGLEWFHVFPFGSYVTMGCWDGVSDADFALVPMSGSETISEHKKGRGVQNVLSWVTRKLRRIGFKFDELEVVSHARVPIIKRKRAVPKARAASLHDADYIIEYEFKSNKAHQAFLARTDARIRSFYKGVNITRKDEERLEIYKFKKGTDAIKLFSRKEVSGITKRWSRSGKVPEIFEIDFDITFNVKGLRNSWFLREYFSQNFLFRIGSLFIKEWSKRCGINNSRKGYLTSYAVSVLWVYYLLYSGHARFVEPETVPEFPTMSKQFPPYIPLWEPCAEADHTEYASKLGRLLYGFFEFYTRFDWARGVVSLRNDPGAAPKIPTKEDFGWTESKGVDSIIHRNRIFYHLCIDDPYEENLNLGRHLSPIRAEWVIGRFRAAHALCQERNHTLLLTPLEMYEEVLRVAMYRHLVKNTANGMDTVGNLRAALRATEGVALATYEINHRLSDLWYDIDQMVEDHTNRIMYTPKNAPKVPPKHPLQKAGSRSPIIWAALRDDHMVPPKGSTANSRVVFLLNSDTYSELEETLTTCRYGPNEGKSILANDKQGKDSDTKETMALLQDDIKLWMTQASEGISHAKQLFESLMAQFNPLAPDGEKNALCGYELVNPYNDPLVRLQTFSLDTYAFPTYHSREQMLEHLRAVALILQKDSIQRKIQHIMNKEIINVPSEESERGNGEDQERMLKAVATLIEADSNHKLNPTIIRYILSSSLFIRQPTDSQSGLGKNIEDKPWTVTPHLLKLIGQSKQHDYIIREK